ncbi:MAG TPA: transcriptional regulator [Bacteroidales bacterium]|nr:transcriptional regulator [Bacteroidales bacterium]
MMKKESAFNSYKDINKLIHEPARTAILMLLSVVSEADFLFVMNKTGLTQGNLSSHLNKLEEAGLVIVTKTFKGKRPNTILKISEKGIEELAGYIKSMKSMINHF